MGSERPCGAELKKRNCEALGTTSPFNMPSTHSRDSAQEMTRDRIVHRGMLTTPSAVLLLLSVNSCTSLDSRAISTDAAVIAKGEVTFARSCSSCHNFRQDGIGPQLGGLTAQVSADWIARFIKDRAALIHSGDQRAQRLLGKYKVVMPSFASFTDDEMAGIIAYLHTQKAAERHLAQNDAKEVADPIPDTIKLSNLVVGLQLVTLCRRLDDRVGRIGGAGRAAHRDEL